MTAELDALKKKRLKWVEANRENGFDEGINRLLTELYPDNAHFIYELLQNAEDPQATEVHFNLSNTAIGFEHNGKRLFTIKDVESITSIGNSTKRDDPTSIGKFGVGFKAVFSYTNTPEIHSGDFHFRIHDLVVPETDGFESTESPGQKTSFSFPFDNPKKPSETAVKEIESGLLNLGDNTLLFLSNIRKIEYTLPDGLMGSLRRIDHDNGRIEIHAKHPGGDETVSNWLHFQKSADVTDDDGKSKSVVVAIAYSLVEETNKKAEEPVWKIVPLQHGQVSIYFPAEKETSNLRFHLHAPFASTVARDSVRDCIANHQLRDCIAELVVKSLTSIRDQGLLTVSFLGALPNPADNLAGNAPFYEPIRKAIVQAFKVEALTPMKRGGHAAASGVFKGPATISDIINDDDLVFLLDDNYEIPMWIANPPQRNQREDKFLESLDIEEWGWSELTSCFYILDDEEAERIETWIAQKEDAWLVKLYALLGEACDTHYESINVSNLSIIRVETNEGDNHVLSKQAFLPVENENKSLSGFDTYFVKKAVYDTGRSETQKKHVSSFFETAGVRIYDLKATVQLRLAEYENPPKKVEDNHYDDIKLFISYFKKNTSDQSIFKDRTFLLGISGGDKLCWSKLEELCLDSPYIETGLADLDIAKIHQKRPIWPGYQDKISKQEFNDFVEFLKASAAMKELAIVKATINKNPLYYEKLLEGRYNARETHTAIRDDYTVHNLDRYLNINSIQSSRLIWNALISAQSNYAKARYRPNREYTTREVESQLVYNLKNYAWIPNKQGNFCKPQDMSREELRDDFPFNNGNGLLTAIEFGENARRRSEEYQAINNKAQEFGFESAERAAKWAELDKLGISPDELLAKQKRPEQPEESVPNPERRRKGVLERGENAPRKESVTREQLIQPGIDNVLAEAKAYLRAKYTNTHGETICQCCQNEMPFKVNGAYYFEAVQCIKKIANHYIENRLTLCPTCAAMYKHARSTDDDEIRRLIGNNDAPDEVSSAEITVTLAGINRNLRFVGTHWFDLKTILYKRV